jgi:HEAT repeat protein
MNPAQDEKLKELRQRLKDARESVRRPAVEEIGEMKLSAAAPDLVKLIEQEKSIGVLEAIGAALAAIGGVETAKMLLPLLASDEARVRTLACETLANIGDSAVAPLIESFSEKLTPDARKFIVDVLGEIRNPAATPLVIRALNDENINVGCSAAESLGKIGDAAAIPALVEVIQRGDLDIGYYAVIALGEIKSAESVGFLEGLLFDENKFLLKYPAIDALGNIGDKRAIGSLRKLLVLDDLIAGKSVLKAIGKISVTCLEETFADTKDEKLRECVLQSLADDEKELKQYALIALGSINEVMAVPVLVALLEKDEELAPFIIQNFVKMGNIDHSFLAPLLIHEKVREIAPAVISGIQSKETIPMLANAEKTPVLANAEKTPVLANAEKTPVLANAEKTPVLANKEMMLMLVKLAGDASSRVRCSALRALGKMGGAEKTSIFVDALKDEDSEVRTVAAVALGWVRGSEAIGELIALLGDPEGKVAEAAAGALAVIGGEKLTDRLIKTAQSGKVRTRVEAIKVLGTMHADTRIRQLLVELVKDRNNEVRRAAVGSLSAYADAAMIDILEAALEDGDAVVRMASVKALSRIKAGRVVDLLLDMVNDNDPWVCYEAVRALGTLSDGRIPDTLMSALIRGQGIVQIAACEVLGNLRYEKARAPLNVLLKSEDGDVCAAARKALQTLDGVRS